MSRADASGISSRTKAVIMDDAKFSKINTITAADYYATGSNKGVSGFIIQTAGNTVITPTEGGSIAASVLTGSAGNLYEIGVKQVSGSGTVHLVY
jgi:hypothetical protein|tara:strand:- start:643 stop:927 length:285 start_codon:yes stop_codon:yes gene_type:complete